MVYVDNLFLGFGSGQGLSDFPFLFLYRLCFFSLLVFHCRMYDALLLFSLLSFFIGFLQASYRRRRVVGFV